MDELPKTPLLLAVGLNVLSAFRSIRKPAGVEIVSKKEYIVINLTPANVSEVYFLFLHLCLDRFPVAQASNACTG